MLAVWLLWPARRHTLVIYSAMGPPGPLIAAFEHETGVGVTYVNMNGNGLLARIYAEGRHPGWDLAWFVGDAAASGLGQGGLLHPWPSPPGSALAGVAWRPEARALLPADNSALPTGLVLAGVFATRGSSAPSSWSALRSWPGTIGLVSPATSGTAFPVLAGMMDAVGGVAAGHALLQGLGDRHLFVAASNPSLLRALHAGIVTLAILPSEAAFAAAARDPGLRVTIPDPAPIEPAMLMMSAGATAATMREAVRFAAFVLSPRGQALTRRQPAEGLEWPVSGTAAAPPTLPPLAGLHLVHPDPGFWGRAEAREVAWFRSAIAGG